MPEPEHFHMPDQGAPNRAGFFDAVRSGMRHIGGGIARVFQRYPSQPTIGSAFSEDFTRRYVARQPDQPGMSVQDVRAIDAYVTAKLSVEARRARGQAGLPFPVGVGRNGAPLTAVFDHHGKIVALEGAPAMPDAPTFAQQPTASPSSVAQASSTHAMTGAVAGVADVVSMAGMARRQGPGALFTPPVTAVTAPARHAPFAPRRDAPPLLTR